MNKIYLYLLPFSCCIRLGFSLPLIKTRIDGPQIKRKETDKGQGSKSTNHRTYTDLSLSILFSKTSQNGVHVTVCLGLNFRTRPHSTLREKEEKTKFFCRLAENVVFQKTVIESTFDYGIEGKYEYLIVHFMSGLLNRGMKSFFRY